MISIDSDGAYPPRMRPHELKMPFIPPPKPSPLASATITIAGPDVIFRTHMIERRRSRISRLGCVCDPGHHEEHADRHLRRREDHAQGEPGARSAVSEERPDLVLHAEQPVGHRRARRRQRRALHQPLVQAELLLVGQERRHLDPRGPQHQRGRRAELRLQHDRERRDPLPVPARTARTSYEPPAAGLSPRVCQLAAIVEGALLRRPRPCRRPGFRVPGSESAVDFPH